MNKLPRNLRLKTETVRILTAAVLPRVAGGGLYTEQNTTSSYTIVYTHCPPNFDCVLVQPK